MIKIKRYLIALTLLILCITLTSCGFISYIHHPADEPTDSGFNESLTQHLEKIEALSSLDDYRKEEQPAYRSALLDAKNELNECSTVAELETVFAKHREIILAIPTDLQLTVKSTLESLGNHISLDDYREAERDLAVEIISGYTEKIQKAASKSEVETLFREFEFEIFRLKTDAVYYQEELAAIKSNLKETFLKKPVYSEYETEAFQNLEELIQDFENKLDAVTTKENANALFDEYCQKLLEIPTISDINNIKINALVLEWKEKFEAFASKHSLEISEEISEKCSELRELDQLNVINLNASLFLIEKSEEIGIAAIDDLSDNCKVYLENIGLTDDYRTNEKNLISSTISSAVDSFNSAQDLLAVTQAFEQAKATILEIPTNDELWAQEDELFFEELRGLYGENILDTPEKMYEASNYEEMGKIIDYYAFYQMSNTEFLRDTFRIKLLYPYQTAQWEINEVYWYCELIRSAAGITGHIEKTSGGDYLVIKLIPYAMATVTNAETPYEANRYNSQITYKSPSNTVYTPRPSNFNDFPYLTKYEKTVSGIWNSQQLWYALEHEYIPDVVEGSAAERVLERAKELLRELISEGMTEEEKIFALFSWYSRNVLFDNEYDAFLYPEDREHFPDELVATLNSFHAEGAFFDNVSVCESFAKSMLIMLRMEGIESYRVFLHGYHSNAINNLGHTGYGSHAFVAIKLSDGRFYISDTSEAYQHNTNYPKLHQLLIPWDLHSVYPGAWTCVFSDLDYEKTISPSIMENLVYNGTSIFVKNEQDLQKIIEDFTAQDETNICISIFQYDKLNPDLEVLNAIQSANIAYTTVTYKGLTEYILYK